MHTTQEQATAQNMAVLANALELGTAIIQRVAGNEIANTIGGETVRSRELTETLAAELQARLSKHMGAV